MKKINNNIQKNKQYFYDILKTLASRSSCDRKQISAIIVRDNYIVSTGYNGSARGEKHCSEVGHLLDNNHCRRTIHAEMNAIINAARFGISIDGATMVSLYRPCYICMKILINTGIKECYYYHEYTDEFQKHFIHNKLIKFIKID